MILTHMIPKKHLNRRDYEVIAVLVFTIELIELLLLSELGVSGLDDQEVLLIV